MIAWNIRETWIASYQFWTTFMSEICPEIIVESKRNNRELKSQGL